jgi:hypothetical protein
MDNTEHCLKSTALLPAPETSEDSAAKIRQLQKERARHVRAIDEIDKVLRRVDQVLSGLELPLADSKGQSRRRYQKLELTGEESVIEFVRTRDNPSTAQVNDHWKAQGRRGVANPIIARLLKRGVLRREDDPSVRGSRYRLKDNLRLVVG